jgi:glycosidase
MNYPLRNAIIGFSSYGDARGLYDTLTEIYSTYPDHNAHALMNILGTHDTERIITRLASNLGECPNIDEMCNTDKANLTLSDRAYARAVEILKIASVIQFTAYGVPSIYYGDEAGLDGATDPFCRKTYPWGREDDGLVSHYKKLGEIRRNEKALARGSFDSFMISDRALGMIRECDGERLVTLVSRDEKTLEVNLGGEWIDLVSGKKHRGNVRLAPDTAMILKKTAKK